MRVVTAAAIASDTVMSSRCEYTSGSGSPVNDPGHGVSRLTGMWLCSGSQSDSKPRSSTARASSAGEMPSSPSMSEMPIRAVCVTADTVDGVCVTVQLGRSDGTVTQTGL